MTDLNHEHLQKLTDVKSALTKLSNTPVPAGDLSNLGKKIDGLAAEVRQYLAIEEQWKKDRTTLQTLEHKLKEMTDKLAPKLATLNAFRAKIAADADASYKVAVPMAEALHKLPVYQQANEAIAKCMTELLGAKSTYVVKLKADGMADL